MYYYDAFIIKTNVFKIVKEFTICTNKNIVEIKYSYIGSQSNRLF